MLRRDVAAGLGGWRRLGRRRAGGGVVLLFVRLLQCIQRLLRLTAFHVWLGVILHLAVVPVQCQRAAARIPADDIFVECLVEGGGGLVEGVLRLLDVAVAFLRGGKRGLCV